jgi:polar amino acid transport system substrate-binding protein
MFTSRSVLLSLLATVLVVGSTSLRADESSAAARQELAPTGNVRVALSVGKTSNVFRAKLDRGTKRARGVAVDLANALGEKLGAPVELIMYDNYPDLLAGARDGAWDVTFLPFSEARAKIIDYGPAYYFLELTYLVPAGSTIHDQSDVDRPGVRVAATQKSISASKVKLLKNAELVEVKTLSMVREELISGKVHAAAASRQTLMSLAKKLPPGARVLEGSFYPLPVSVGVLKNRPAALAYVTDFIESAKATGVVRRAFDNAGFKDAAVASAASGR